MCTFVLLGILTDKSYIQKVAQRPLRLAVNTCLSIRLITCMYGHHWKKNQEVLNSFKAMCLPPYEWLSHWCPPLYPEQVDHFFLHGYCYWSVARYHRTSNYIFFAQDNALEFCPSVSLKSSHHLTPCLRHLSFTAIHLALNCNLVSYLPIQCWNLVPICLQTIMKIKKISDACNSFG